MIRQSKDRQHNDLQNITHKTKDRVTRTEVELRCSEWVSSSCSISGIRRATLATNPVRVRFSTLDQVCL
jgi:hypothetical protein